MITEANASTRVTCTWEWYRNFRNSRYVVYMKIMLTKKTQISEESSWLQWIISFCMGQGKLVQTGAGKNGFRNKCRISLRAAFGILSMVTGQSLSQSTQFQGAFQGHTARTSKHHRTRNCPKLPDMQRRHGHFCRAQEWSANGAGSPRRATLCLWSLFSRVQTWVGMVFWSAWSMRPWL